MHDSVREFVHDFVEAQRESLADSQIIEFGSLNVNGTVRDILAPIAAGYIGIDGQAGPGVDYQCFTWNTPFEPESFDIVVSTEMLEHDENPSLTFKEANRLLRHHGHLVLTARGPGFPLHEYPGDFWRFTPDDLARLARLAAQGVAVHRARSHGIAGDRGRTRSPQTNGAHQCPDCPFTSTTPNGLTRHRRQQHGPVVDPPAAVETGGKIDNPNFDGHHRLAHERRVGHQIDAYCACGEHSGATDREDARDWLHQHLDSTAA